MSPRRFRASTCGLLLAMAVAALAWPAAAAADVKVNDPLLRRQWGLRRIGAPAAWASSLGKGMTIAIVDTGVDPTHEDLKANLLTRKQYDAINDDFDARDLCPGNVCHGTAVAGVAAAVTNNRKGIAGTAPQAKIMAVRAFGALAGANPADVADGILWAADNGANVINLSLGGPVPIDPFLTDLQELSLLYATAQGALVVAAAGNAAQPFCSTPAFNPAVVCVGASDELDGLADFSNYFLRLDVVAPGTNILTTDRFGYNSYPGTSFAAPFVAGVGALLMSMGATNIQAAYIIRATAKDLGLP